MKIIEVRTEGNHILVQNDKYPQPVNCIDAGLIPDIGTEYVYLQWSDAHWYEKYYVDQNNHIQSFTTEQAIYIEKVCNEWIQPKGQEGNPDLEQVKEMTSAEINARAGKEFVAGFKSNALGSDHYYQYTQNDQLNYLTAYGSGVTKPIKCTTDDITTVETPNWVYIEHTNEQLAQLISHGSIHGTAVLTRAGDLKKAINAIVVSDKYPTDDKAIAAVKAIVW